MVKRCTKTSSDRAFYPLVHYFPEYQASQGKESITRVNGLRNTPELPKSWAVTPLSVAVFDIIMNKGKIMGEFDSCRGRECSTYIGRVGVRQPPCDGDLVGHQDDSQA